MRNLFSLPSAVVCSLAFLAWTTASDARITNTRAGVNGPSGGGPTGTSPTTGGTGGTSKTKVELNDGSGHPIKMNVKSKRTRPNANTNK